MKRAIAVLLLAAALPLMAAEDALPKGEEIMDRYVAVTGGREVYEKLTTLIRTVTMEVKAQDLRFPVTTYLAKPGKAYTVAEIPSAGKVEEGVDGEVAWSMTAARGAALKQGGERELSVFGSRLDAVLNWREWFPRAENAGTEVFEGRTCHKLVLTDLGGGQHTRFYDKETGLLARVLLEVQLPQGKLPMETRFYDYRETGGPREAYRTVRTISGQEIETRVEKIEINGEIDPARFAMPDVVKALLEKQKSGS
jgi:hypothetical protein